MILINLTFNIRTTMTKKICIFVTVTFMLFSAGCSTYNSFVPNWATIGASTAEATVNKSDDNDDSSWWNPFSWF